MSSTVSISSP